MTKRIEVTVKFFDDDEEWVSQWEGRLRIDTEVIATGHRGEDIPMMQALMPGLYDAARDKFEELETEAKEAEAAHLAAIAESAE